MKTLTYYQDPGHGWLAVPVALLQRMKFDLTKISPFSFMSRTGSTVYLEEDCDAPMVLQHFKELGFAHAIQGKYVNPGGGQRLPSYHGWHQLEHNKLKGAKNDLS